MVNPGHAAQTGMYGFQHAEKCSRGLGAALRHTEMQAACRNYARPVGRTDWEGNYAAQKEGCGTHLFGIILQECPALSESKVQTRKAVCLCLPFPADEEMRSRGISLDWCGLETHAILWLAKAKLRELATGNQDKPEHITMASVVEMSRRLVVSCSHRLHAPALTDEENALLLRVTLTSAPSITSSCTVNLPQNEQHM